MAAFRYSLPVQKIYSTRNVYCTRMSTEYRNAANIGINDVFRHRVSPSRFIGQWARGIYYGHAHSFAEGVISCDIRAGVSRFVKSQIVRCAYAPAHTCADVCHARWLRIYTSYQETHLCRL